MTKKLVGDTVKIQQPQHRRYAIIGKHSKPSCRSSPDSRWIAPSFRRAARQRSTK